MLNWERYNYYITRHTLNMHKYTHSKHTKDLKKWVLGSWKEVLVLVLARKGFLVSEEVNWQMGTEK